MRNQESHKFQTMFSRFRTKPITLLSDTNEVVVGSQKIKLTPKEMGVLEMLNDRMETTVTRAAILEEVWGAKYANDQGLTQAISRIRGILDKSQDLSIRTIPKKGYQLQKVDKREKIKAFQWVKTHPRLTAVMFVGLILGLLILTDQVKIRVTKEMLDKGQASQSKSIEFS